MLEQALRARLIADETLEELVSDRIRPTQAALGDKFPAVVYQVTASEDPSPTIEGVPSGWWLAEITYAVVAETYAETQVIATAITASFAAIRNSAEFGATVAYVVQTSASDDEQDREGKGPLYVRNINFQTLYKSTPTS